LTGNFFILSLVGLDTGNIVGWNQKPGVYHFVQYGTRASEQELLHFWATLAPSGAGFVLVWEWNLGFGFKIGTWTEQNGFGKETRTRWLMR
jgi:hypothetical protein